MRLLRPCFQLWTLLLGSGFLFLGLAQGQGAAADRYAAESIVVVRSENVYAMAADGTGYRQRTVAARVQSEAAVKQLGVLGIPYAGSSERVEIAYARVRRPDGTVTETPVGDALEMPDPVTREAPFYSDLKQKQLPIRNLRVGDTLEWQAKIVRTKAEAPGEFWGQEWLPDDAVMLGTTVELRVPVGKAVTVWSPGYKAVETAEGKERVYRWTYTQLKPTAGKEAEAAAEAKKKTPLTAEQELDAREGKLPSIAWTTFPSWEAVGAWYRGLEGDRMEPGPEVKAKVAELTAGKTTEEEKVRAVYGYVATQVRYIGVAFGVGRYQPHRATEVMENQYGDCKDKHTLLAAMLGALGLRADAVLIGAGIRFNPAVPSPAAFNHLITHVDVAGKPVWLDATAEVAPYRMLVAVIRDRRGLVVPEAGAARVERTPAELPFKPFQTMEAVGTLDKDGVSNSKITLTFRGDAEVFVRAALRSIPPGQYDQLVQNISQGMSFGGTTSHAEISRAEDTAEPLVMRYDYKREKAGDWDNYRTVAQLPPVALPIPDEKEPPVASIELGGPLLQKATAAMKLPEGWGAELPEAVHAHSKYVNWDQTYRIEKGTLYAERTVEVLVERVPVSEWKDYKKWTDVTTPGTEKYVQLTRTGCCGASGPLPKTEAAAGKGVAAAAVKDTEATGGGGASGGEPEKLLAAAFQAMQANDLKLAAEKLDAVKAANPKQPGLWGGYGYLALRRGETTEALADDEKELALHPEETAILGDIARLYGRMGKPVEQVATFRRWVAADPASLPANLSLVQVLSAEEDAHGAEMAAEAAAVALPEEKRADENFQLALGTARLKGGKTAEGQATMVGLLKTSDSPVTLNGAAYELADAGLELPLAETSTREALRKLGEQSRAWTLDENQQMLVGTSGMIVATWDTMGWVLFREGKMDEAESFLRAAWRYRRDAVVGEHLGDLLAKKGDRAGAAKMYALALESVPGTDPLGLKKETKTPEEMRLARKMAGAGGHEARDAKERSEPFLALEKLDRVSLGANTAHDANGYYKLLVGAGGVVRAQATGDKDAAGGVEALRRGDFSGFFPKGSEARLVLTGRLTCHEAVCEFAMQH